MRFGKGFAEILEGKSENEDEVVEHIRNFIPDYPKREFEYHIIFGKIPLFAKFDGWNARKTLIGEYKTGRELWTQERVDRDEQLTFYAFMVYLKTKKIPKLELTSIKTDWIDGQIAFTGALKTFQSERTIWQLMAMGAEIQEVWKGIIKTTKEEFKKIGKI